MDEARTAVGINLAGTNYWATEFPFINRIKDSGQWAAYYADGTKGYIGAPYVDGHDDLVSLPPNATNASISFEFDPIELATTDRYVLTYSGTATFTFNGATIVSAQPGKVVFDMTKAGATYTNLNVTNVDHLSNMAIVREDQVDLYNNGEMFNPEFIEKISPFATLRFMNWEATNNSTVTTWDQRAHLDDRTWMGATGGVPIEAQVALANETHNDMWINIPFDADDNYVTQDLTYIRDNLDPSLKVKVEFSNEVWNWGFQQSHEALTKGDQLWGTDANHDGKIDPNDPAEHVGDGYLQYYGYRAAQVAAIANSVFAAKPDQVVNVLEARGGVTGTASIVNGVTKATAGSITTLFDDMIVNTYFGGLGDGGKSDLNKVLKWAQSGAAGVDAAFAELENGGSLSFNSSVAALASTLANYATIAQGYGLDLMSYEGGVSLIADQYKGSNQTKVLGFYQTLLADPRMGQLYDEVYDAFQSVGGKEIDFFNDAQNDNSVHGIWGALDNIYQDHSMRYDTLVALATGGTAPTITGTAANDALYGTTGNDTIDGLAGNDTMTGGKGDDTYKVDATGDKVVENPGEGHDLVLATAPSYTLAANVEDLTYQGTGAFSGVGNADANVIHGGAGTDSLNGGLGNDTLYGHDGNDRLTDGGGVDTLVGGAGDDIYYVGNTADVITELAGEGADTVYASVSYSIAGTQVETLNSNTTAAINLTGDDLDNTIRGNDAANALDGGAGKDTLWGNGGNDTLTGGAGNDSLLAGPGDDVLIGGAGLDTLRGDAGADTFRFLALSDTGATHATADLVYDFDASDHIDLAAIDAIAATSANDAFKFIGTAAFGGHAGELRQEYVSGKWDVSGDVNGDKIADFVITVNSPTALVAGNFIL